MVALDKHAFKAAFNRLAVATRLPADQADAAAQRIYFEGLQDIPIDAIVRAAQRMEQSAQWFPKVVEWRKEARETQREETRQALLSAPLQPWEQPDAETKVTAAQMQEATNDYLTMREQGVPREDAIKGLEGMLRAFIVPAREAAWHHECELCEDSGMELRTCYPDSGPACGVRGCKRTAEHSYTLPCACRETNRTFQRNRARGW